MFWIPLIAMHTGARRNELCQLTPEDIIGYKGVPSFRIADDAGADKTMKTGASVRIVPIHSNLIRAGFLIYVERNKKNLDFLKIIIKKPQITFFLLIIFLIMLLYLHIF